MSGMGELSTIQLIKGEVDPNGNPAGKEEVAVLEVATNPEIVPPPPMTGEIYKPCSVDVHDGDGDRNLGGSPNGVLAGDKISADRAETPKSGNSEVRPPSALRVFTSNFLTRFKCCGGKSTDDDAGNENEAPPLELQVQDIIESVQVQAQPGTVTSATEEVAAEQLA